jgi:hypothetical protein
MRIGILGNNGHAYWGEKEDFNRQYSLGLDLRDELGIPCLFCRVKSGFGGQVGKPTPQA